MNDQDRETLEQHEDEFKELHRQIDILREADKANAEKIDRLKSANLALATALDKLIEGLYEVHTGTGVKFFDDRSQDRPKFSEIAKLVQSAFAVSEEK